VPISVLAPWSSMEIEDCVNTVLGAEVDYTVKVFEALLFQNTRIHVI